MNQPQRFDEAFRQWAARPVTSGAEAAAKLFAPRERRRASLWLSPAWATLASAALMIGLGTAWWLGMASPTPRVERAAAPEAAASRPATGSADSDVVVMWIDDQTPVHVFLTEASARGAQ